MRDISGAGLIVFKYLCLLYSLNNPKLRFREADIQIVGSVLEKIDPAGEFRPVIVPTPKFNNQNSELYQGGLGRVQEYVLGK
jgi:hypothetical protein